MNQEKKKKEEIKKKTFINGFLFIDVPAGALNMQGKGNHPKNDFPYVEIKKIRENNQYYNYIPYISGQALKYWIRNVLESKFGWTMSPIKHRGGKKEVASECNPVRYPDDDMFGYMFASDNISRIAPFKVSYLVGYLASVKDTFNYVYRKDLKSAFPFNQDISYGCFGGIYSIDLFNSGRFVVKSRAGFKNFKYDKDNKISHKDAEIEQGLIQNPNNMNEFILKAPEEEDFWISRKRRVLDIIRSFNYLSGGANQTLQLIDTTPRIIILSLNSGGNNIFGSLISTRNPTEPDPDILDEIVKDYEDILLSKVFIGIRKGSVINYEKWIKFGKDNPKCCISTPINAVKKFISIFDGYNFEL